MLAIEIKGLKHVYQPKHFWHKAKTSLSGLSLSVEEGEIFGYLGANGAGKTTTIKVLVGLHRETGGEASLFGVSTRDVNARRTIGFQPENPYFYEYLTAVESMHFYAGLCDVPRAERKSRSDELLEFVGLTEAQHARVGEYSKGMRQRLGIAQALVHKPKLVILDEPMSGLDPVGRRQVREAITSLKERGMTVFFSSHVLQDVEMICDRVGLLMNGKLETCGPMEELLSAAEERFEVGADGLSSALVEKLSASAMVVSSRGDESIFVYNSREGADQALMEIQKSDARLSRFTPLKETLEEYFMRTTGKSRAEVGQWSGGADK